jgi:hypothetical protein
MRDYPTLHLYTNQSKGTAGIKKGYGCKWTLETTQRYTYTQIKVKEQLVLRKDMDVKLFLYFDLCISVTLGSL